MQRVVSKKRRTSIPAQSECDAFSGEYRKEIRIPDKSLRHDVAREIVAGCPVEHIRIDDGFEEMDIFRRKILRYLHKTLDSLEFLVKSTFFEQSKTKITELISR